jgi:hypothetical protein
MSSISGMPNLKGSAFVKMGSRRAAQQAIVDLDNKYTVIMPLAKMCFFSNPVFFCSNPGVFTRFTLFHRDHQQPAQLAPPQCFLQVPGTQFTVNIKFADPKPVAPAAAMGFPQAVAYPGAAAAAYGGGYSPSAFVQQQHSDPQAAAYAQYMQQVMCRVEFVVLMPAVVVGRSF